MGCGCGKNKTFPQSDPLVIGEPNAMPAVNYRTTVSVYGMRAGTSFWATGSGVDAMVQATWLVPI